MLLERGEQYACAWATTRRETRKQLACEATNLAVFPPTDPLSDPQTDGHGRKSRTPMDRIIQ